MGGGNPLNAIRGAQNRNAGRIFEQMIEAACRNYRQVGLAEIDKTPEPMQPVKSMGQGRFLAHYEKKAQPDFKGTLKDGRSIVFEAKLTTADRIKQEVILPQQAEALERHHRLGAECFILVSFDFREYFKVPWTAWRDMKTHYGHKYLKPEEIQEYKITMRNGLLRFLERAGA